MLLEKILQTFDIFTGKKSIKLVSKLDIRWWNFQIEEILYSWNDREHGGQANRHDLIQAIQRSRRSSLCLPLINALMKIEQGEMNDWLINALIDSCIFVYFYWYSNFDHLTPAKFILDTDHEPCLVDIDRVSKTEFRNTSFKNHLRVTSPRGKVEIDDSKMPELQGKESCILELWSGFLKNG